MGGPQCRPEQKCSSDPTCFWEPHSYLPAPDASDAHLIPGALSGGGLVSSVGSISYPDVESGNDTAGTAFTQVTSDLYYSAGYLGTLKIPAIGLSTKVYQGTDSAALRKGVGHFKIQVSGMETAALRHTTGAHGTTSRTCTRWNRAIPLPDHQAGTRTYEVISVTKVRETDTSGTAATSDNRLTLYTCVRDQRDSAGWSRL